MSRKSIEFLKFKIKLNLPDYNIYSFSAIAPQQDGYDYKTERQKGKSKRRRKITEPKRLTFYFLILFLLTCVNF